MNKKLLVVLLVCECLLFLSSGCSINQKSETSSSVDTQEPSQAQQTLVIYAPASTSSIPVILAVGEMQNVDLQLYTNQSQANAVFMRGDAQILVSGLSVGVGLYKNDAPIQVINSYVTGLSYLVTYGKQVTGFSELNGQSIYVPFEGSPIEEVTSFLVSQQGLTWNQQITPIYSPFESSIELLKQGDAQAVILPEPNVTLVEGQPDLYVSMSLFDEWNKITNSSNGYPQVSSFVNPEWASSNGARIDEFNQALADAIDQTSKDPESAVNAVASYYKLPAEKLLTSLTRTHFNFTSASEMRSTIENYYQTIGKVLDENFESFYYIPAQ